jgi:hypothetical protein
MIETAQVSIHLALTEVIFFANDDKRCESMGGSRLTLRLNEDIGSSRHSSGLATPATAGGYTAPA